ncbi:MAG TPA: hypothetical protein VHP33_18910 [Polyangiaceae bacterium]|nr:hypothetical protein [Polyangiaceae bacterium]
MLASSVRGFLCALVLLPACSSADADPAGPASSAGASSGAGTAAVGSGGAGSGNVSGSSSAGATSGGQASGGAATAGSGGSSAGAPSAGSGGSGTGGGASSPCGTGSVFCTDFEDAAVPAMLLFYPEYLRASQKLVALDSSVFRGGKQSLKVSGTDYSQMLGVAVPSKFWGRVYLRSDTDIQEGHNTYVAAGTGTGDPNAGTYIRIGEHQCQLELNRNTDDKELLSNGGQYKCEGGVKLLKDTWYCLEFYYDGPGQETRVFVDGTEVTALHTTDWGVLDYKIFKFGFEKYHGAAKTLWYDDLAIASQQLHCLK